MSVAAPRPLAIPPVAPRRRRTDRVMRGVLLVMTLIALVPLVLVVYYLLKKGLGAISWDFFTTDPTGRFLGDPGGIKSAIVGTVLIVGLATLIAVPVGIGVALYLVEYGKKSWFSQLVRYFVDVMTGVPSIVFGLFIYIVLVLTGVGRMMRKMTRQRGAPSARAASRSEFGTRVSTTSAERVTIGSPSRASATDPFLPAKLPPTPVSTSTM